MSRICVKNLSKTTQEKTIFDVFSSRGEVTDVRLMKTKSGISRRFAFVGFKSEEDAKNAMSFYQDTYLDTAKIFIEPAKRYNEEDLEMSMISTKDSIAPRSMLTKRKVDRILKNKSKENNNNTSELGSNKKLEPKVRPNNDKKGDMKNKGKYYDDFMEVMKSRKSTNIWSNDEHSSKDQTNESKTSSSLQSPFEDKSIIHNDDDDDEISQNDENSDSDSDVDSVNDIPHNVKTKASDPISDMDFLRGKVSKSLSNEHDSDSDSEESESSDKNKNKIIKSKTIKNSKIHKSNYNNDVVVIDTSVKTGSSNEIKKVGDPEFNFKDQFDDKEIDDSGRLFIRNLTFTCSEDDLKQGFESFGQITEVHIPLDSEKKCKGYGFVHFMFPEHASTAMAAIDGTPFQGRLLHVIPAQRAKESEPVSSTQNRDGKRLSSFQVKKEEERKKLAGKKEGWNASFVRSDAVVDSLAETYGIKKSDILDTKESGGEMAVRLAIGEAQIIQENRDYFSAYGVDIAAIESHHSGNKANKRSTTTLLVKNLPHDTNAEELESMFARFGGISSFLLPKSKTMALVDYVEPGEARAAQKGLAYRSYHKMPLYIEWAPTNVINKEKAAAEASKVKSKANVVSKESKLVKDGPIGAANGSHIDESENFDDGVNHSTIFVKNLNFSTSEEELKQVISQRLRLEGLRTVSIQKKKNAEGKLVSMGFGFVEFRNITYAVEAIKKLHKYVLAEHALEVKQSDKRLSVAPDRVKRDGDGQNTKLVVRNVPFQATATEIRALFVAFGCVKKVRIPKRMGGIHRGFAFVEFSSHQEALAAKLSLSSAHLYGRHLVLEWAKEEEESLDSLRKRAGVHVKVMQSENKKRKLDDSDLAGSTGKGGGFNEFAMANSDDDD